MQEIVNAFNEDYKNIAEAEITFTEKMPMFEKTKMNTYRFYLKQLQKNRLRT